MSDVPLAKPYAADNYAKALSNLVKRYEADGGPVHYSDAAFDDVSEDQAGSALKYFGEIGIIEIVKQAHYEPSDPVVTWQRSMPGPAKEDAKSEVLGLLSGYEVYDEACFLLSDGGRELDSLAQDIGGKLGISEDDLSMLVRSIEVLAACDFLKIDEEGMVTLPHDDVTPPTADEPGEDDGDQDEDASPEDSPSPEPPSPEGQQPIKSNVELSISIDVTELDESEIRSKLDVIQDVLRNDGD